MEKVISKLLAAGRSLGGIVIALMAAMTVSSCNEAENDSQMVNQCISLDVSMEGWNRLDVTRASYSAMSESSGNKLFGMSFTSGDAIGLFACDKTGKVVIANQKFTYSGSAWSTETPIEYITGLSGYTFFAYYPWVSSLSGAPAVNSTPDISSAESFFSSAISAWTPSADQSTLAAFTGSDLMVAKGTNTMPYFHEVSVSFSMAHQMALAVTKNELSYYDIDDPTDTWSEPQTFSGNIPYAIGTERYFIVKPGVETTLGTKSTTLEARQVEQMYFTNGEPVYVPVTDLSMVDNAGNERASMSTANCYLVHAAGKYKLPLVYGNAIKNGAVNTISFNPGTVSNGVSQFTNHNSTGITGPWITKNGSGINAGMNLTAESAELVWQNVNGLISSVSINGDYLIFKVRTFTPGNALIAVKDETDAIMWSWHIWATEDDLSNTTVVATGSHNYIVAPVNLGWVPTGGSGKQGICPYYQWGRKDPFIPANPATLMDQVVYDINGNSITGITYSAGAVGIKTATRRPTYFYYNSSTGGPLNVTHYNFWDARNSSTNNVSSATKKTIYDPCPPGFCVPTGNLFYYLGNGGTRTMSTWDQTNKGAIWNTNITGDELWFPASGYRYFDTAVLTNVRNVGMYWSATPYDANIGNYLAVDVGRWTWETDIEFRAFGFTIRPVLEE